MHNKLDFLTSRKFWAGVIFALATWLLQDGYITEGLSMFLQTLSALFIGVNMGTKATDAISSSK